MDILITIFFLIGAGLCKAYLDYIADSGLKQNQWPNKYDFTKNKNHWWYFSLYKPKYSEKFIFSSTILAFLTDKWHKIQFFMLRFFYLAIAVNITDSFWVLIFFSFVLFPIVLGISFELLYKNLKK